MYRNCEGYADPTAGAAFAHIEYEERKARKKARNKQKPTQKPCKNPKQQLTERKSRRQYYDSLHYRLAWTEQQATRRRSGGGGSYGKQE